MIHQPRSILLVEDDIAHAEITRRNLEEFRDDIHELVHIADGQAALDYLHASPLPHLILLDLRLPRVDGLEVLRQVKHDPRLRLIPVIVLTTSRADADVRGAYERGANAYLVKPVAYRDYVKLTRAIGTFWIQSNWCAYA